MDAECLRTNAWGRVIGFEAMINYGLKDVVTFLKESNPNEFRFACEDLAATFLSRFYTECIPLKSTDDVYESPPGKAELLLHGFTPDKMRYYSIFEERFSDTLKKLQWAINTSIESTHNGNPPYAISDKPDGATIDETIEIETVATSIEHVFERMVRQQQENGYALSNVRSIILSLEQMPDLGNDNPEEPTPNT